MLAVVVVLALSGPTASAAPSGTAPVTCRSFIKPGGSYTWRPTCAFELARRMESHAGGFLLRTRSACVPLEFRVGERTATVRLGVGRRFS